MQARVILKPRAERKLRNFYPWAFHDDIAEVVGDPEPGAIVWVREASGALVGQAFYNPQAAIPLRMLSLGDEPIDAAWFRRRLLAAAERRRGIEGTNAVRLVHGEADGLPGLIVDRYGDMLVVQIRNLGMERRRELLVGSSPPVGSMSAAMSRRGRTRAWRRGSACSGGRCRIPSR